MKRNKTIVSVLVAAALSLPFVAFASSSLPGSTDEARALAHRAEPVQTAQVVQNAYTTLPSSTDEARERASQRYTPIRLAVPSQCFTAGAMGLPTSTDDARAVAPCLQLGDRSVGATAHVR